jgi:hypothetical protein
MECHEEGPPGRRRSAVSNPIGKEARGEVCRIRLGYRSARWWARSAGGEVGGGGRIAADREGLARLVFELGGGVEACLGMMSGALWVGDELAWCGWRVGVADARKLKTVAPLAAKTDRVDARLLAGLCRRRLVPALWLRFAR